MKAGIRVAATLFSAALFLLPAASSPADDPGALRLLATRIAAESGNGVAVELDVATLAQLPVPLTFPREARVIGSLVRRPATQTGYGVYRYTEYHVYLDAAESSEQLTQAIVTSAAAAGYAPSNAPFGGQSGGFVTMPTTTLLCKSGEPTSIAIRSARVAARTEAVVTISVPAPTNAPISGTACGNRLFSNFADMRNLPVMKPVEGVRIERRSNSSGTGYLEQTVDVYTALSPGALLGAWTKQLSGEGWTGPAPTVNDEGGIATFHGHGADAQRLVALTLARIGEGHLLASIRGVQMEPSAAPSGR